MSIQISDRNGAALFLSQSRRPDPATEPQEITLSFGAASEGIEAARPVTFVMGIAETEMLIRQLTEIRANQMFIRSTTPVIESEVGR